MGSSPNPCVKKAESTLGKYWLYGLACFRLLSQGYSIEVLFFFRVNEYMYSIIKWRTKLNQRKKYESKGDNLLNEIMAKKDVYFVYIFD